MQSSSLMVFEKDREVKSGRRKEAKFFLMPPLWQLLNRARPPTDGELAREIALIDDVMLYPAKLLTHSSG